MHLTLNVRVGDYTVQQDESGRLHVQRHGLAWRDCTGDQLVCALAHEVESLRAEVEFYKRNAAKSVPPRILPT